MGQSNTTLEMKSIALCVLLAVQGVWVKKLSCNNVLENKNVSFEYNFYPSNQLEPEYKYKFGYTMLLPDTGNNTLTYTNGAAWRTEKCGNSLCIVSMKKDWKNYYLYMGWGGGKNRQSPFLEYYEDIKKADPAWNVQFDIECDDCNKRRHCYIIHRFKGNSEDKNYGRLFTDAIGFSVFGYLFDETYEDWFDWAVHEHNHVPAGAAGPAINLLSIFATMAVWMFNLL